MTADTVTRLRVQAVEVALRVYDAAMDTNRRNGYPVFDETATPEAFIAMLEAQDPPFTVVPATSSPESGLDVERLARALFAVHPLMYPQSWPDDDPDDIGPDPTEDATAIAAEYARLASENRSA